MRKRTGGGAAGFCEGASGGWQASVRERAEGDAGFCEGASGGRGRLL